VGLPIANPEGRVAHGHGKTHGKSQPQNAEDRGLATGHGFTSRTNGDFDGPTGEFFGASIV
jgi:hypothetical protein